MVVAAVQDMSYHFYEHSKHRQAPLRWAHEAMKSNLHVTLFRWWTARGCSGSRKKRSAEGERRRSEKDSARVSINRASKGPDKKNKIGHGAVTRVATQDV